jgi:hypothetical protein
VKTIQAVSHVHSEWSYDGRWSLESLADAFSRRGCSVILSSEHDRGFDEARLAAYRLACAQASNDRLVVVPGIEYSDPTNTLHVLVWGRIPFLGEGLPTEVLLERVAQQGGLAVLAHPWRKDAWRKFDPTWTSWLSGIELWNRKSDGWRPEARVATLLENSPLLPFASLDFHVSRQFFPLRMKLQIPGPLNEDAVIEALRARRCRPTALGLDATKFGTGVGLYLARWADQSRQLILRRVRRAKQHQAKRRLRRT